MALAVKFLVLLANLKYVSSVILSSALAADDTKMTSSGVSMIKLREGTGLPSSVSRASRTLSTASCTFSWFGSVGVTVADREGNVDHTTVARRIAEIIRALPKFGKYHAGRVVDLILDFNDGCQIAVSWSNELILFTHKPYYIKPFKLL